MVEFVPAGDEGDVVSTDRWISGDKSLKSPTGQKGLVGNLVSNFLRDA